MFQGQEYDLRAMEMLALHDRGLSHSTGRAIYDIPMSNLPKPSAVDNLRQRFDEQITNLGLVIHTVLLLLSSSLNPI